jgi:hypothetical protein
MQPLSIQNFGDNLPVTTTVGVGQTLLGFGLGLLVADRVGRPLRDRIAIGLVAAGAAALLPTIVGIASTVSNRPASSRRMRKQLDSIRRDTGISENSDQF